MIHDSNDMAADMKIYDLLSHAIDDSDSEVVSAILAREKNTLETIRKEKRSLLAKAALKTQLEIMITLIENGLTKSKSEDRNTAPKRPGSKYRIRFDQSDPKNPR
ncbi:hypothetical protein PMIN03_010569 [Paraphaeosphaeria minitans]